MNDTEYYEKLDAVLSDVMKQAGGLVFQRYDYLNEVLMETARRKVRPEQPVGGWAHSSRKLGTILAALRYWQQSVVSQGHSVAYGSIATNLGTFDPLTADEIDELCEDINCAAPAVKRDQATISSKERDIEIVKNALQILTKYTKDHV